MTRLIASAGALPTARPVAVAAGAWTWALLLFACVAAVLLGLVASSASPVAVALAATLVLAPILIIRPTWSIWTLLVGGLLIAGVVPIWAEGSASKVVWGLSGLSFLLLAVVLVRALLTPAMRQGTPMFVWLALAFLFYGVLNGLLQWAGPFEVLSAIKRYYQAFGLMFALCWLPLLVSDVQRWRKLLLVVALLQLPWAIYERVHLVPIREGFKAAYPGLVPIDVVAGTFGANMYEGGANGAMAAFLIVMLAFILANWREKRLGAGRALLLALLVMLPLFLGETKIVVLLLPLMFLVLYRAEILRRPHVAILGLLTGAAVTAGAVLAYVNITGSRSVDAMVADTVSYNFENRGHGRYLLNRTTALRFWAERQSMADPAATVVGNGLGSAHDATGGHMAVRYAGYGIGLTAASTLLWDLGVFGLLLFLAVVAAAWRAAGFVRRHAAATWMRADAVAIQAALPIFSVFVFYRMDMLEGLPFQIVFATLLGHLAWMYRQTFTQAARR